MNHIAFTVDDNQAHIIIKDENLRVIHDETLDLGHATSLEVKEWLACKAAIRQGGAVTRGQVRLYSDCGIIEKLAILDCQIKPTGEPKIGWKFGEQCSHYENREMYHYFDAIGMLWKLFKGKWEVLRVEKERIKV